MMASLCYCFERECEKLYTPIVVSICTCYLGEFAIVVVKLSPYLVLARHDNDVTINWD